MPRMSDDGWNITEDEHRHMALLLWLTKQADELVNVGPFYKRDPQRVDEAREDVEALSELGWIDRPFVDYDDTIEDLSVSPTGVGKRKASELRGKQNDRRGREWACRSAAVAWMDNEGATSEADRVDWGGFLQSRYRLFYGTIFIEEDRRKANTWLATNELIDGSHTAELGVGLPHLAAAGNECAEYFHCDVRAYMNRNHQSPVASGHIITVSNVSAPFQVSAGDGTTQTMDASNNTAENLELAFQGLVEILQSLKLSPTDDSELQNAADEAISSLGGDNRDVGKVRTFLEKVRMRSAQATSAGAVAALTLATTDLGIRAEQLIGIHS